MSQHVVCHRKIAATERLHRPHNRHQDALGSDTLRDELLATMRTAFPASILRHNTAAAGDAIAGTLCVDGVFTPIRIRLNPHVECYVTVPNLDGFFLLAAVKRRWLLAEYSTNYQTNDRICKALWIDATIADAHAAQLARHEQGAQARATWRRAKRARLNYLDDSDGPKLADSPVGGEAWSFELTERHVLVRPRCGDFLSADIVHALRLAAAHASRPTRIASELVQRIKQLGFDIEHRDERITFATPAIILQVETVRLELELRRTPTLANVKAGLHWLVRGNPLPSVGSEPDLTAARREFKSSHIVFAIDRGNIVAALPCERDGWVNNVLLGRVIVAVAALCRGGVVRGPYR